MAVICQHCTFGKETQATVEKVLKDPRTGQVVKTESAGSQRIVVCKPPGTVSGFPYRGQVVNEFGSCDKGESK